MQNRPGHGYVFDLGKSYGVQDATAFKAMLQAIRRSHPEVLLIVLTPITSVKEVQEPAYSERSIHTRTIGRYSHVRLHDLTAALDALPDLATPRAKTTTPQAMAATGTDPNMPVNRQQYSSETMQNGAESCEPDKDSRNENEQPNVLPYVSLSDKRREAAEGGERGAGGSRTHEWRFCKPLP